METLDDKQLAMAFDCEGGFCVAEDGHHYNSLLVSASIAQSYCDELLYRIKNAVGYGAVSEGQQWEISGKARILTLLDRIEPYLIVKKNEAVVIRAILGTVGSAGVALDPRTRLLREKYVEYWKNNYSRKAKKARRSNAINEGTVGDFQVVPS
jgi:hypothetical protein